MKHTNGRYLIGRCGVDSGQLLIVDPCYLGEWQDGEFDCDDDKLTEPAKNNYDECCKMTLTNDAGPVLRNLAVVSETGWGDGYYPVYAKWKDGRVVKLEILFDENEENEIDE